MASTQSEQIKITNAVDFGNTKSGVAVLTNLDDGDIKDVVVITDWPGDSNAEKIPTRITAGSDNILQRFGALVRHDDDFIEYFKILLDKDKAIPTGISREDLLKKVEAAGKTPIQIAADFLREVRKAVLASNTLLDRYGSDMLSKAVHEWVITVPALWSDAAKDATRSAAIKAGMGKNLRIISEPEAAAVFTLMGTKTLQPRVGQTFILLDAGGGTLDAITYTVVSVSPLRLKETVEGQGVFQGGAFFDEAAKGLVRERLGRLRFAQMTKQGAIWEEALKQIERRKTTFGARPEDYRRDVAIRLDSRFDDRANGIIDGELIIPPHDFIALFQPTEVAMIELVEQQFQLAERKGFTPDAIIVVGGSGQSPHLFNRIRERFGAPPQPARSRKRKSRRHDSLEPEQDPNAPKYPRVLKPTNGHTAVMQGAVIHATTGGAVVISHVARQSYGFRYEREIDEEEYRREGGKWDQGDACYYSHPEMHWAIRKGDDVPHDFVEKTDEYKRLLSRKEIKDMDWDLKEWLFTCHEDDPPTKYGPSVKALCEITIKTKSIPGEMFQKVDGAGPEMRVLYYDVGFKIRGAALEFFGSAGGSSAVATAEFA
ncbi:Hsp70 protein-like protein 3 [Elsinoe fawcettii]|nr:Hsp70 protein-like protein 3 [Elsinoe fawcettii]